ncbi:Undecaprenyl-diphosphatase BcrC [subsurface metagenome]
MDLFLFQGINSLANFSKVLDWIGIFLAEYTLYVVGAVFLILLFWKRNWLMVISAVVSVILSRLVITEIIKNILYRPRPYVVLETAEKLITENADFQSFPSGHAAIFFAIAMAIYFFNKKLGIIFFVSAVLIGFARIFVGIHWPSDVLVGAVIGIISGIIIIKLFFKKHGQTKNRTI